MAKLNDFGLNVDYTPHKMVERRTVSSQFQENANKMYEWLNVVHCRDIVGSDIRSYARVV